MMVIRPERPEDRREAEARSSAIQEATVESLTQLDSEVFP